MVLMIVKRCWHVGVGFTLISGSSSGQALVLSHRGIGDMVCCVGMNPLRSLRLRVPLLLRKKGRVGLLCVFG